MKRAVNLLIFVIALAALLVGANLVTRRDDGALKYGPFFAEEREDAFDVLFVGTRRVLTGILPPELWREYGVTSYNMGNNSEPLGVTEWVLRLALERHKPKVAVFDVFYIDRPVDLEWTYSFRHLFFDEVPLSSLKLQALRATLPEKLIPEFALPFILYHGRWDELVSGTDTRQVDCEPCLMGGELRAARTDPAPFERTHDVSEADLPGLFALRNIAQICRESGVEPIFICLPSPATREEQMEGNAVYALADELGVPYLNMLDIEGVVDFSTDFHDYLSHLNPDGAIKVTRWLGQWLSEHYDLADHRQDASYGNWDAILQEYDALLDEQWGHMTLLHQAE